ncbi:MAG: NAD(P)H-dependent glycerol-3-phosphate dehydrogenase [Chloroflexota bacterium]
MSASQPAPVAVAGTTTWGATLAIIMARQNVPVRLLARTPGDAVALETAREHPRMAGHAFPASLSVTHRWDEGLAGVAAVLFAVPSHTLRENARRAAPHLAPEAIAVSAAKGLEQGTFKRMSTLLTEELPQAAGRVCALSGPNLAREVVKGLPTSTVVASDNPQAAGAAQALLNSMAFRVYTNADLLGTELAGALKNVIAIGAGICDGMGLGDNARAAFITRGLAEITRLGVAAGAQPVTFMGNAGMGDLLATCYSGLSRNHRVGLALAAGKGLEDALAELGGEVAEGVKTTVAALEMGAHFGVEMPIAELTARVLFQGMTPRDALAELMARTPRPE